MTDTYEYVVDDSDRIVSVSQNWLEFAAGNDAQQLTGTAVLGTPIWRHIAGIECRAVYNLLFSKVRDDASPIVVPFCCDSPTLKRFMELTISPEHKASLKLTGRLVRAEPRSYSALLDPGARRRDELITMCSWCKQVKTAADSWLEIDHAVQEMRLFESPAMPGVTHGMCPLCLDGFMREIGAHPQSAS